MATPTPDPATVDHLGNARGRLLSQWKGKASIDLVVQLLFGDQAAALTGGWRDTEATIASLLAGRRLDTAVGVQLDGIGTMVGQTRLGGESDADYLMKLRAAVLRNKSAGAEADLSVMILALLVGKATSVAGIDKPPAAFVLSIPVSAALTAAEQQAVTEFVQAAKGAGIGLDGLAYYTDPVFGFDEDPDTAVGPLDDGTVQPTAGLFAVYF